MKMTRLLLMILILSLTACFIPNRRTYYQPATEGGKLKEDYDFLLRRTKIVQEKDGIELLTRANHCKNCRLQIQVLITGPLGSELKSQPEFFLIKDLKTQRTYRPIEVARFQRNDVPAYRGSIFKWDKVALHGLHLVYELEVKSLREFSLSLPAGSVIVNGSNILFNPVYFKHTKKWDITFITING